MRNRLDERACSLRAEQLQVEAVENIEDWYDDRERVLGYRKWILGSDATSFPTTQSSSSATIAPESPRRANGSLSPVTENVRR
jgi:hypothetical protein